MCTMNGERVSGFSHPLISRIIEVFRNFIFRITLQFSARCTEVCSNFKTIKNAVAINDFVLAVRYCELSLKRIF